MISHLYYDDNYVQEYRKMKQYIVDAFTDEVFKGNPAAVCIMDTWLSDTLMLKIVKENNLSETAFAVKEGDTYHLRWFTPSGEIDLCGHATLAASYVITRFIDPDLPVIRFTTLSGILEVTRKGDLFEMDFPSFNLAPVPVTDEMADAIGVRPLEAYLSRDLLLVLEKEQEVRNLTPDLAKVRELPGELLHVSSKGSSYDCVSRSFAPKLQIDEDPVCGSGHCHIVPYWANRLGKDDILAFQASERTDILHCQMDGERVRLSGKAALFSIAELVAIR